MDSLANILGDQYQLRKYKTKLQVTKVLTEKWHDIFGKLGTDFSLYMITGTSVIINTKNPMWVNEILFYKKMLLKKINDTLPFGKIVDIQMRVVAPEFFIPIERYSEQEKIIMVNPSIIPEGWENFVKTGGKDS